MKSSGQFLIVVLMSFMSLRFGCAPAAAYARDLRGTVVRVSDGDTVWVRSGGRNVKIGLYGIDAPERGQPYYMQSKMKLRKLVNGKQVRIVRKGRDARGRELGLVYLDRRVINRLMVSMGYAWSRVPNYRLLEESARARRLGLWRDKKALAPWKFRQNGPGGCKVKVVRPKPCGKK